MNNNADHANFDKMLALAELGAKQHNDRRQVEFRVFISYITLLALAFYQLMKVSNLNVSWWPIVLAVLTLVVVHILYCMWQTTMHIASNNDVRRRDFYLKKAESIAYHLSQNTNSNFVPSLTKTVIVNLGARANTKTTERDLFKQLEPDIFIPRKKRGEKDHGTRPPKWYKNLHNLFPTAVTTVLMVFLIVTLILKKLNQLQ